MLETILIFIGLILILLLGAVISQMSRAFSSDPPYVPIRKAVVPEIARAIDLHDGDILYDLGCGDGRVLRAAVTHPSGKIAGRGVGIDNNWLPLFLARRKSKGLPIEYRSGDLFKADMENATHIYCYLLPRTLALLETIILERCRKGTKVVTCDYFFPNMVPKEKIPLRNNGRQIGNMIYVYGV